MKSKFTWIFTLFMAFFIQFSFAQEKTVTGVVTDSQGPLPGVNVVIQSTREGVSTDIDGRYSIRVSVGQKLEFSYLSMKTQVVTVGESNTISVQMEYETEELKNVVVEAYRTSSKVKSTIASTTITAKTIENRPNPSFVQTLQGQVPGLNISTGSGQPGSGSTVILRGVGSINGNIEPLYVIDGMPQNADNFRSINPNDIESVSVLKDAAATSIYGNRGANGVIIVKTKRGSFESALDIKYNGVTGFTTLQTNDYNLMNSQQLLRLERAYGEGEGVAMTDAEIDAAPSFDWVDYFFRTAISQSHTLSLTSGSKNLSSFTSVGFLDQEGVLTGTGLKRFNFRSNLNGKSNNDRFSYGTSMTVNYSKSNLATNLGTGAVNQNYVIGAYQSVPYITPDDYIDGIELSTRASLTNTPLFLLDKLKNFQFYQEELKMIGNAQANFKITPELSAGTSLGVDYTEIVGFQMDTPFSFNEEYFRQDEAGQEFAGFQSEGFNRTVAFNTNTNLTYAKIFAEDHTIEASAFLEYFKAHAKTFGYTQTGLDPVFYAPGTSNGWIPDNIETDFYVPGANASKAEAGLFSYFASVDYDYQSRFGFSATIRRDNSFKFIDENKWGTFYSVAGRWNIDQESFMQGSPFQMLKLRASYGTAGNQDITGGGIFGGSSLTRFLYGIDGGYNNSTGYGIFQLPNRDLRWETIAQANIGIDFEVLQQRLRGTIDVYQKTTTDLYQSVPLSAINGTSVINSNYGDMRNRGIELLLNYQLIQAKEPGGFNLSVNFNGAYNKNELLELPSADGLVWGGGLLANREGDMLNQYYLYEYAGVNPANGNLLFYDANGAITESPKDADRKFTGKSAIPKFNGGFGFDADYNGFFLTTLFTYVADIYRFDYDYSGFMDPNDIGLFNKSEELLNYWTPDNRVTDVPSLYANNIALDNSSDRWLKDASYLRLRYVTLGYNVPLKMIENTPFTNIRAFVQGENIMTWTKWKGFDAESPRPNDQAQYPTPRSFSIGLELGF